MLQGSIKLRERYSKIKDDVEKFHCYWKQTQPYKTEFAENYNGWDEPDTV